MTDGTVRHFAKTTLRVTIALLPMMTALYTVAFFELDPLWWAVAGAFGTIATKDYVGSITDNGGNSD